MLVADTDIEQFLFDSRNWRQKKIDARRMPDGMTHAPDSGVDFMAPVSGACVVGIFFIPHSRHVTIVGRLFTYIASSVILKFLLTAAITFLSFFETAFP